MNTIVTDVHKGMATITFNRPKVRNAISLEMVDEVSATLHSLQSDPKVKVLIFTGVGNTFVSGGDLGQFLSVRGMDSLPLLQKVGSLLNDLDAYPKPTIAMLNGAAIGGGCEFAASCHFRYASESAMLGFVQIGMHITTGWGGGSRLLAKLSESSALTLLLTGERITAARAKEIGFVDHVATADQLETDVYAFAEKIARQPLVSIQAYMNLLRFKREGVDREESVRREIEQCASMWGSEEHVAVINHFLNKK